MAITKEQFTEFCATEEGKKLLFSQAASFGMVSKEDVEKLVGKKAELLTEKKAVQEELKKAKDKIADLESDLIGIEDLKKKTTYTEQETADLKKTFRDTERKLKTLEEEKNNLQKKLDSTTSMWHNSEKGRALSAALASVKVKPEDTELVHAAYRDRVKVRADENGLITATITDNGIDKPVEDFFKSWSETNKQRILNENISVGGGAAGRREVGASPAGGIVDNPYEAMFPKQKKGEL